MTLDDAKKAAYGAAFHAADAMEKFIANPEPTVDDAKQLVGIGHRFTAAALEIEARLLKKPEAHIG